MRNFWTLLRQGNWRGFFLEETDDGFLAFFRYLFVGAISTVVDWALLFGAEGLLRRMLSPTGAGIAAKYIAATLGFAAGVTVSFFLSRAFVFKGRQARSQRAWGEFLGHSIIGAVGLGFTEGILWAGDAIGWHFLCSKAVATVVVLFWNYFARKYLVYRRKEK